MKRLLIVVLASQYWGQRRIEPIKKIIGIGMKSGLLIGVVFFAVSLAFTGVSAASVALGAGLSVPKSAGSSLPQIRQILTQLRHMICSCLHSTISSPFRCIKKAACFASRNVT